jgi:hypothetical protein
MLYRWVASKYNDREQWSCQEEVVSNLLDTISNGILVTPCYENIAIDRARW